MKNTPSSKARAQVEVVLNVGIKQRLAVSSLLNVAVSCPRCGASPFPTGDVQKFSRAMDLVKALHLDDLDGDTRPINDVEKEENEQADIEKRLPGIACSMKADILRMLLDDVIVSRSWMLAAGAVPFRDLLSYSLPLIETTGQKLRGLDEVSDEGLEKEAAVSLRVKERILILRTYQRPQPCQHMFQMGPHGAPADNPKTLKDILDACRAYDAINLGGVEAGADEGDLEKQESFTVDKRSCAHLRDMLIRRTETMGLTVLAPLVAKFSAAHDAAVEPPAPAPEPTAPAADAEPETAPVELLSASA